MRVPAYNHAIHNCHLIIPENCPVPLKQVLEIARTIFPLVSLYRPMPFVSLLPLSNMIGAYFLEGSKWKKGWLAARNGIELVTKLSVHHLNYEDPVAGHNGCNVLESLYSFFKANTSWSRFDHFLNLGGNVIYIGSLMKRPSDRQRPTTIKVTLLWQVAYQAFKAVDVGFKLYNFSQLSNYQKAQLSLDLAVRTVMSLVRLYQVFDKRSY